MFDSHDTTARVFQTLEWQDVSLAAERNKLLAHEVVSRIKTTAAQQKSCRVTLDNFARITWPNHDMDLLRFPKKWQNKLAQNAAQIQTVDHLRKELNVVGCHLDFSSLSKCGETLVVSIKTTLESITPPTIAPIARRPRQVPGRVMRHAMILYMSSQDEGVFSPTRSQMDLIQPVREPMKSYLQTLTLESHLKRKQTILQQNMLDAMKTFSSTPQWRL